jgi:hypothetical protein
MIEMKSKLCLYEAKNFDEEVLLNDSTLIR